MLQRQPSDVMRVSSEMVVFTWIAFIIAALVLSRLLWKPILRTVEKREKEVSDALAGAEQARRDVAEMETHRQDILAKAGVEAQTIRSQASLAATAMISKADSEAQAAAQRHIANAEKVIDDSKRKAFEQLRLETANYVVGGVEHILRQHLTDEQKRVYHEAMLNEVHL